MSLAMRMLSIGTRLVVNCFCAGDSAGKQLAPDQAVTTALFDRTTDTTKRWGYGVMQLTEFAGNDVFPSPKKSPRLAAKVMKGVSTLLPPKCTHKSHASPEEIRTDRTPTAASANLGCTDRGRQERIVP